ncbi:MAG: VTT domain-containing protein [Candidatus Thorarchaeota archaeon]
MRTSDKLFILAVLGTIAYGLIMILIPDTAVASTSFYYWIMDAASAIGYSGAFAMSFLGNATILVPFPYVVIPFVLGANIGHDPWLVGLVSGIGAAMGEMIGYFAGYYGRRLLTEEDKINGFSEYVQRRPNMTPFMIWILAATPIPDDLLIVPLGVAQYSWWKVFVPLLIGKAIFLTAISWAGRLGLLWVEAVFLGGDPSSLISISLGAVGFLLIVLSLYLIVRVDWSKRLIANAPQ